MPILLIYNVWIFFVYKENERYHTHIVKKGDSRTISAKVFLTKEGKRNIEWASFGKYQKNVAEIEKIIEENYDYLINSAKASAQGKKIITKVNTKKTKK